MINLKHPQQKPLFDPFEPILTKATRKRLLEGWQGVFRHVILELMPVKKLAESFSEITGAPTKELYSVAGLLVIKEFMDWTKEEAVDAYCFHMGIQYALNMEPVAHDICERTIERYQKLFDEKDLAAQIMHEVTTHLISELNLKIDKQRLDSTHVFSDMASFGRTRLMGVAVKRFLIQVKRHDPEVFQALDEEMRTRYQPSAHQLFGDVDKGADARKLLLHQVAQDMYALIARFGEDETHAERSSYKALERIFHEQCEVKEETGEPVEIAIKKKPGGDTMQNPSDPGATYDGHKGPGYQVQIAETCHEDNEVQLITSAIPQTAVESDSAALAEVIEDLEKNQAMPEQLLADASYGGDDNVQECEDQGVELVSPTKEGAKNAAAPASSKEAEAAALIDRLTLDDFNIDEDSETVICCPAGHTPESSVHDPETGKTTTFMALPACLGCEFQGECPIQKVKGKYRLEHTSKQRRLASRRREEQTEVFRERYRKRSGIEGTNSGIKRRTGLGRLRVRGRPRVFTAILLKLAGWNILRASVSKEMRKLVSEKAARLLSASASAASAALEALSEAFWWFRQSMTPFPVPILEIHPPATTPIAA